jgi:hypothetical protein
VAARLGRLLPLLALAAASVLIPSDLRAQDDEGGPGTLVLRDLEHPLNGTWTATNDPTTMECVGHSLAMPAGDPEILQVEVYDGGHRLEIDTRNGRMTMRAVTVDEWESEVDGEQQILRKKVRDDANWFAYAVDGAYTLYEGIQTPIPEITIHFIMAFDPAEPTRISGHLRSSMHGCRVVRGFTLRK